MSDAVAVVSSNGSKPPDLKHDSLDVASRIKTIIERHDAAYLLERIIWVCLNVMQCTSTPEVRTAWCELAKSLLGSIAVASRAKLERER